VYRAENYFFQTGESIWVHGAGLVSFEPAPLILPPAGGACCAGARRRRQGRAPEPAGPIRAASSPKLPFGFWERLLTHGPPGKLNYEMALWRPALHRAFPNSRRRRVDVHKPIPTLRDLRNRHRASRADYRPPARGGISDHP
jgi:hypothetical protein